MVGLTNAEDTTDLNKVISNLTQTALNLKADDADVVQLTGDQTIVSDTKPFVDLNIGGDLNVTGIANTNKIHCDGTMTFKNQTSQLLKFSENGESIFTYNAAFGGNVDVNGNITTDEITGINNIETVYLVVAGTLNLLNQSISDG
jgi:hypothetical protein